MRGACNTWPRDLNVRLPWAIGIVRFSGIGEPLTFIFITDEELRASLESDYAELRACLAAGAWKAAHVMSGAIVEAVLVDYLLGAPDAPKDPLKMTLEELIAAGRAGGVLSGKTADLSTVIRGFRNLIHPGRVIRLNETIEEEGARIADALVSLIVREVAAKQAQQFGLTAEQLLAKFEGDPTALAIADHLLRDSQLHQLERLLLVALPERYLVLSEAEFMGDDDCDAMSRLERLYISAYDAAPDNVQKKVAKRFLRVLREEAGRRVEIYEDHFFRGTFLEHLTENERKLVKDHLFSRIQTGVMSPQLVAAVEGLSAYLRTAEINRLFDALVRTVSYADDESLQGQAQDRIESEFRQWLSLALEPHLLTRLDQWVSFHHQRNREAAAQLVEAVRSRLVPRDDDIPF